VEQPQRSSWRRFWHGLLVTVSGVGCALACFLLLPMLRAITAPEKKADMIVREAPSVEEPPPPVEEDEPEQEEEEPPPPKPAAEAPPLDLSQLEMALSPGDWGGVGGAGSFALPLDGLGGAGGPDMSDLFDFSGLEEEPRPLYRARPRKLSRDLKKALPCTVYVLLTVNENGQVESPTIHSSDDPRFNSYALEAIRQWRFEPGKRNGKPDSFRVRQPITFK